MKLLYKTCVYSRRENHNEKIIRHADLPVLQTIFCINMFLCKPVVELMNPVFIRLIFFISCAAIYCGKGVNTLNLLYLNGQRQNLHIQYTFFDLRIYFLLCLDHKLWNAVTVLCGQLDCDDGHL